MLKKEVTYEDLNGEQVTETLYFNLSKAELIEMEIESPDGGFGEYLKRIVKSENKVELIREFKRLILKSYGVKSEDGRRFIKTQEMRDEFAQSEAYSTLFMQLATDEGFATEFVNGIMPSDLAKEVGKLKVAELPESTEKKFEDYSKEELLSMPSQEFQALVGTDPHKMSRDALMIAMQRRNQEG